MGGEVAQGFLYVDYISGKCSASRQQPVIDIEGCIPVSRKEARYADFCRIPFASLRPTATMDYYDCWSKSNTRRTRVKIASSKLIMRCHIEYVSVNRDTLLFG